MADKKKISYLRRFLSEMKQPYSRPKLLLPCPQKERVEWVYAIAIQLEPYFAKDLWMIIIEYGSPEAPPECGVLCECGSNVPIDRSTIIIA